MKTFRLLTSLSVVLFVTCFFVSCKDETGYRYFLIKVDSVLVSEAPVANSPFDINFYGIIGTSGCHTFSSFNVRQDNSDILIEVWGKTEANVSLCPTVIWYLTGHKVTYTVKTPGTYNIKVKQPDNSYLVKQIAIK